jgi:hypothetical protein
VCVYSVFVLFSVGSGLATDWSPIQESYRLSVKLKELKWNEAFDRPLMLQRE